jgi:hypothetical protein
MFEPPAMHRSAAPDKHQKQRIAEREGAAVSNEAQDETSRRPERQGTGHDERGRYGSAAHPHSPDRVKPEP